MADLMEETTFIKGQRTPRGRGECQRNSWPASVAFRVLGLAREEPPLIALAAEQRAPERGVVRQRQQILGEQGDHPGLRAEFPLQLPGGPAGVAEEAADVGALLPDQLGRAVQFEAEVEANAVGRDLPAREEELPGLDRAAGVERDGREGPQRELALEFAEASAERTIEDQPAGALGVVEGHQHDRPAEVVVAQARMGQQEGAGDGNGGKLAAAGHRAQRRRRRTPASASSGATIGSFW